MSLDGWREFIILMLEFIYYNDSSRSYYITDAKLVHKLFFLITGDVPFL